MNIKNSLLPYGLALLLGMGMVWPALGQVYVDVDSIYWGVARQQLDIGLDVNHGAYEALARHAYPDADLSEFTAQQILDAYADNPFIGQNGIIKLMDTQQSREILSLYQSLPMMDGSGMPGAGFDHFAKGLTLFLVERFKQELSITFFRRFKKKLEAQPDLELLFPQTYQTLDAIGQEIYQFNTYMNELRSGFVKDMQAMPGNARRYLLEQERFFQDMPAIKYGLADAFHLSDMLLEDHLDILEVFHYLGQDAYIHGDWLEDESSPLVDVRAALSLSSLMVGSLADRRGRRVFASRKSMSRILKEDDALVVYCGLLYQKIKHIRLSSGKTLGQVFLPEDRVWVGEHLRKTLLFVDELNAYKIGLQNPDTQDSVKREIRYKLITGTLGLLEAQFGLLEKLGQVQQAHQVEIDRYVGLLSLVSEMSYDLRSENYSSAMVNLSQIIEGLPMVGNLEAAHTVMKYGTFASEMAEARSPAQAQRVLERYAMPVGGSAKKKHARFDVSLNAYMGLGGGTEILYVDARQESAGYATLVAPVGLAVSRGWEAKGALTAFFPILDVGALAAFRLDDQNFDALPQLKFQNVFAPGAYLVYGFPNDIPISIGAGVQMGPNLRKVTSDSQFNIDEARGIRAGLFLAVDIPIFSIYASK